MVWLNHIGTYIMSSFILCRKQNQSILVPMKTSEKFVRKKNFFIMDNLPWS